MSSSRRLPGLAGLPVFSSYNRSEVVESEALNNLVKEDLENEVMDKVTRRENRLLASPDYACLTDKQKM